MALICAHTFKAAVAECVASAARMDKCRQAVRTVPAGWFYSYYSCCHNAIFLLEEQLTGSTYKTAGPWTTPRVRIRHRVGVRCHQ